MFICKHLHANINVSLIFQTQHLAMTTGTRDKHTLSMSESISLQFCTQLTYLSRYYINVRLLCKLFMLSLCNMSTNTHTHQHLPVNYKKGQVYVNCNTNTPFQIVLPSLLLHLPRTWLHAFASFFENKRIWLVYKWMGKGRQRVVTTVFENIYYEAVGGAVQRKV